MVCPAIRSGPTAISLGAVRGRRRAEKVGITPKEVVVTAAIGQPRNPSEAEGVEDPLRAPLARPLWCPLRTRMNVMVTSGLQLEEPSSRRRRTPAYRSGVRISKVLPSRPPWIFARFACARGHRLPHRAGA